MKDQEDNFPEDAAINELDLADPKKRDKILKTLLKFGVAPKSSTNPKKAGSQNTLPINLFAEGPAKSKPAPPAEVFPSKKDLIKIQTSIPLKVIVFEPLPVSETQQFDW